MQVPQSLLQALEKIRGFNHEAFTKVHALEEQVTSIRLNPLKILDKGELDFKERFEAPVPWTKFGYYLKERPSFTFDPFFHAGCYYVQEASSMFLEEALNQTVDLSQPLKILDLSAAPGGKSTHIQSLISSQSLLVCNEVIRSRVNILKDNIVKWGSSNVIVTNNDPSDFGKLNEYFDVLVVDAPCSGSGLFRRDPESVSEWSLNNVTLCSQRQQRILADAWPSLKKGGVLIYSTCSYSPEEDEDIISWLKSSFPASVINLQLNEEWNIVPSGGGYRFWPDKVKGEGLFIACLIKENGEETKTRSSKFKSTLVISRESEIVRPWLKSSDLDLLKVNDSIYACPKHMTTDFYFFLEKFRLLYGGVKIGQLIREKLVPDHSLAMSIIANENLESITLDHSTAIRYLQRKELSIYPDKRGWVLVKYKGKILGWVNILSNRINNYYPKELRILKDN